MDILRDLLGDAGISEVGDEANEDLCWHEIGVR